MKADRRIPEEGGEFGESDFDPSLVEGIETDRWRILLRLSGLLNSRAADLDRTLRTILGAVLASAKGERAALLLKGEDGRLEVEASRGAMDPAHPERPLFSWSIVQRVFESGQGIAVPEMRDEDSLAGAESVETLELRSALCVPLKTGVFEPAAAAPDERRRFPPYLGLWRDVIGVLYVDSTRPRKPYDQEALALLTALANVATTAITNARLYAEATRDPATGLVTRRHFEVLLARVHRLSRRHGFPYAVLLLEFGSEKSPEDAGRALGSVVRASDLAARYGPRLFAALLPYVGREGAATVAAKIEAEIPGVRIGASSVPESAPTSATAVLQADRALGAARVQGTCAVVFWSDELGLEGPRADSLAGFVSSDEAGDHRRLEALVGENEKLRGLAAPAILGSSASMQAALQKIQRVASTPATLLLTGESGTGKELLARAVHALSRSSAGPFVVVDCGAIPENLLESELFGHEAGAFTGAAARHVGKFERASNGTLFLDEVGELPLALQVKFLRALQERKIERVGGTDPIPVDVRIVAATNRDLEAAIVDGSFRQDLYYRLHVVAVELPPLRERGRDILVLARHFLDRFAREFSRPVSGFDEDALRAILSYSWPGNVRELENRIQQAAILAEDPRITAADLALPGFEAPRRESYKDARQRALDEFNRRFIEETLARLSGDVGAAAKEMGLSERRFRELRAELGIQRESFEE